MRPFRRTDKSECGKGGVISDQFYPGFEAQTGQTKAACQNFCLFDKSAAKALALCARGDRKFANIQRTGLFSKKRASDERWSREVKMLRFGSLPQCFGG